MSYCKGIYCGCAATGCMSPCGPCERIRKGTSTVEKEMRRKDRAEHRRALPPRKRVVTAIDVVKRVRAKWQRIVNGTWREPTTDIGGACAASAVKACDEVLAALTRAKL